MSAIAPRCRRSSRGSLREGKRPCRAASAISTLLAALEIRDAPHFIGVLAVRVIAISSTSCTRGALGTMPGVPS